MFYRNLFSIGRESDERKNNSASNAHVLKKERAAQKNSIRRARYVRNNSVSSNSLVERRQSDD
jgi:hypothetical protein